MEYPTEILPNTEYKYIDCDLALHYLLKHTDLQYKDFYDTETGKVKLAAICHPKENIADLSTSLLGIFNTDYTRINLTEIDKKKYNCYCESDDSVQAPSDEDYQIVQHRNIWFVKIGLLKKLIVCYNLNEDEMIAECEVIHTPMKWNFWYFSIRWKTHAGELRIGKNPKKWEQRLCNAARNTLSELATINTPYELLALSGSCYLKS